MSTLADLQRRRDALHAAVIHNTLRINEKLAKTVVACTTSIAYGHGCGNKFFIKNLTYLQTHWYETPHGCSGGDIWHAGEGQFICPLCEHRNRLYDRRDIEELKGLFKQVVDEHKG